MVTQVKMVLGVTQVSQELLDKVQEDLTVMMAKMVQMVDQVLPVLLVNLDLKVQVETQVLKVPLVQMVHRVKTLVVARSV